MTHSDVQGPLVLIIMISFSYSYLDYNNAAFHVISPELLLQTFQPGPLIKDFTNFLSAFELKYLH